MDASEAVPSTESVWDSVVIELRHGISMVDLANETVQRAAFANARKAFEIIADDPDVAPQIQATADSAHATGYHPAASSNSLSRYNDYREGFVFSDNNDIRVKGVPEFRESSSDMEDLLHKIARCVLAGLERFLNIPLDWFETTLGPIRSSSQWHIKNYTFEDAQTEGKEDIYLLPTHTDPSIVSVIIHDRPGKQAGSQGLRYSILGPDGERSWAEVPYSGHAVAIVLVGSILSRISGGYFPACCHSVTQSPEASRIRKRMAATLFARPNGGASLTSPPSDLLQIVPTRRQITFDSWNARVARNYMKSKGRKTKSCSERCGAAVVLK
jgi:isopenicillin N synthase-like dioxygenase